MKKTLEEFEKLDCYKQVSSYASGLYQLSVDVDPCQNPIIGWIGIEWLDQQKINKVLHEIHCKYPNIRSQAIELIAKRFSTELIADIETSISFDTRDTFKGYRIKEVDEILKALSDDIVWHYAFTFRFDHVMRAEGLNMENIRIIIKSATKESLSLAVEKIKQAIEINNIN